MATQRSLVLFCCALMLAACGTPASKPDGGSTCSAGTDRPSTTCQASTWTENVSACVPSSTDYQPRDNMPGDDGWPACISDDNTYHLIGSGVPAAAARVVAFEAMAAKLWKNSRVPSAEDFLSARNDYSVNQGLASRVARRQDVTYAEVPGSDKFACAQEGIPAQYPDRCAGPAKLKPLLDEAFVKGSNCEKPLVQAAKIEAALLWFMHLSMTSEVWTCSFDDQEDCDAAVGYYTSQLKRSPSDGYAKYVSTLAPETHERIFDALLSVRCWRDADQAMPAGNTVLYTRALEQLNQASLRGMAVVLRDRISKLGCTQGEDFEAAQAFVQVLGAFLDHSAQQRNAVAAEKLKRFVTAPTAKAEDIAAAQSAIDTLFDCP